MYIRDAGVGNWRKMYTPDSVPVGLVDMNCSLGRGVYSYFERCQGTQHCASVCGRVCNPPCAGCVVNAERSAVTLKRKPRWWHNAPGIDRCKNIAAERGVAAHAARTKHRCNDYVCGSGRASNTAHSGVVVDVGMHDGGDTIYWLSRGFKVVAVDANVDAQVFARPVIANAHANGQLVFLHAAVAPVNSPASVTFYRHKTASQLSTLYAPSSKRYLFDAMVLNTTTCADILHRHSAPLYLKIDIEGADAACVNSLAQLRRKPSFLSTEDPTLLGTLVGLGYRRFKMVPQYAHRTGGQFSGGWSEEFPEPWVKAREVRKHRFFSIHHMHEAVTSDGTRVRREHDLHARMW